MKIQVADLACCVQDGHGKHAMNFANSAVRQAERYCLEQRWDLAEKYFRDAVDNDPHPVNQLAFGCFLAERQQYHPAIVQWMQALDGAQAAGDLAMQTVLFANLAAIYRDVGETDLAQRFQRQVLSLSESAGAQELLDWSSDALLAGKLTLAEHLARQAFEIAEASEEIELQSDACGTLGVIAAREGHLRRALWLLIRAARGHQHIGDDHGLASDYQNLGEVCGLLDRLAWQRGFFTAAHAAFTRCGRPRSQARAQARLTDTERLAAYRTVIAERN